MRNNGYQVDVITIDDLKPNYASHVRAEETIANGHTYVALQDGQKYELRFKETTGRKVRSDIKVTIDGKNVMLDPDGDETRIVLDGRKNEQEFTLSAPVFDQSSCFTFFKTSGDNGAIAAAIDAEDRGLIKVTIRTERPKARPNDEEVIYRSVSRGMGPAEASRGIGTKGFTSGATGLSGHNTNRHQIGIGEVYDYEDHTTIFFLRLVAAPPFDNRPRHMTPPTPPPPVRD